MKIATRVRSDQRFNCPFCFDNVFYGTYDFDDAVTHLQERHSLSCLHIGSECGVSEIGQNYARTVAIFGGDNIPARALPVVEHSQEHLPSEEFSIETPLDSD